MTLEDPVERIIAGANQTEIRPELGLGYCELLNRLLRQDPDVIMIGEIREQRTAAAAMQAAVMGTLVLSTIHAGTAVEVFLRLLQLGMDPALVGSVLRLAVSQRLLPLACRSCGVWQEAKSSLKRLFMLPSGSEIFSAPGCSTCHGTGTAGRAGVFELLAPGEGVRGALLDGSGLKLERLQQEARKAGWMPLLFAVREALLAGRISPAAALRAAGVNPEFAGY